MRISKLLVVTFPLALAGCDFFGNDSDTYYSPSPAAAPVPAPLPAYGAPADGPGMPPGPGVPPGPGMPGGPGAGPGVPPRGPGVPPPPPSGGPGKPSDCGCPGTDKPQGYSYPGSPPCPVVAPDPDWKPTEHQLVQAGDLIVEMREKQGNPSHAAMATHIQTRMGLTAPQAERVLEEMGL